MKENEIKVGLPIIFGNLKLIVDMKQSCASCLSMFNLIKNICIFAKACWAVGLLRDSSNLDFAFQVKNARPLEFNAIAYEPAE